MSESIPSFLYKYRELNKNTIDNLKNNTIWLSNLRNLNDPTEPYINIDVHKALDATYFNEPEIKKICKKNGINGSPEEKIRKYCEYINSHAKKNDKRLTAEDLINDVKFFYEEATSRYFRIFSLTETGPYNKLMWAHYGRSSTGICIKYNMDSIETAVKKNIFKIEYVEKPTDLTEYFTKSLVTMENNKVYYDPQAMKCMLEKPSEWHYEQEWRLIMEKRPKDPDISIVGPKIDSIYLGTEFFKMKNNKYLETIFDVIDRNNSKLIILDFNDNTYEIKDKETYIPDGNGNFEVMTP